MLWINLWNSLSLYTRKIKVVRLHGTVTVNNLEIGIDKGDSLRLWREYLTYANICGIDIDNDKLPSDNESDYKLLSLKEIKKIPEKYT